MQNYKTLFHHTNIQTEYFLEFVNIKENNSDTNVNKQLCERKVAFYIPEKRIEGSMHHYAAKCASRAVAHISKNRAIEECYRESPNGKMCESVTDGQTHNHETPRAKQKCRHKISYTVP